MSTKKSSALKQLILGALVGAAFGYFGFSLVRNLVDDTMLKNLAYADSIWETPLKLVVLLFSLWAAWAVHELGHLLTGLALGFRFHLYIVGLLGIRRNSATDKVEWFMNRDAMLAGGIAATVPVRNEPGLTRKFAAIVAMGPIVSLLGGLLAGAVAYALLDETAIQNSAFLRIAIIGCFTFAAISLLLFLATTIPSRTGAFFTDRARFFRLIRGGRSAAIEQAIMETLAKTMGGESYSSLDKAQLELIGTEDNAVFQIYAKSLLFRYHLDRGEWEEAFQEIQQTEPLMDGQPALFKNETLKELALAHALIAKDAEKAQSFLNQINPPLDKKPNATAALIKSAIAAARAETAQSHEYAHSALKLLPATPVKSEDKQIKQLLEKLLMSAEMV